MAETKTKKPASKSTETASTREALVKKVSAEQKAATKTKKTTTAAKAETKTAKKTDVVRTSSLEEKYLAKVQSDKKPATKAKSTTKATESKASKPTAKSTSASAKPKAESKSEPKETKVVKATPKAEDGKKDVRVGNVVVDEDMAKTKVGMQQSKKDKQKNLAIVILSSLLVVVVVVSLIFILSNLNKDEMGEMKIEGQGVIWMLNDKELNTFVVTGAESFVYSSQINNLKIAVKKTTNEAIDIRFELRLKDGATQLEAYKLQFSNPNSMLRADEDNGCYYLDNWNAPIGTILQLSGGFFFNLDPAEVIDADNCKIEVTAYIA